MISWLFLFSDSFAAIGFVISLTRSGRSEEGMQMSNIFYKNKTQEIRVDTRKAFKAAFFSKEKFDEN
jgi:hypothetical protein